MKKKRVLLTRNIEDCRSLASFLHSYNYAVFIGPLIKSVSYYEGSMPSCEFDAIIVTGGKVFDFIKLNDFEFESEVITVGNACAEKAKQMGFGEVISANGNVHDLISLIQKRYEPGSKFLYLRGTNITYDIKNFLESCGYTVEYKIVYSIIYRRSFSKLYKFFLIKRKIDFVLFYSEATVSTFVRLISESGLYDYLSGITAVCISKKVADKCNSLSWKGVLYSDLMNSEDMLKVLFNHSERKV